MSRKVRALVWQIPVTVLVSIVLSMIVVWPVSTALGFSTNYSLVAAMSGILAAVAVAVEVGRTGADVSPT